MKEDKKEKEPQVPIEKQKNNKKTTYKMKKPPRKAGLWVPSLENGGGRLKSPLQAQLSLHTQCPNLYACTWPSNWMAG